MNRIIKNASLTALWMFVVLALLFVSCTEFLEKSVDQAKINVLSPLDSAHLDSYQPLFWWDSVPGAKSYHVQIVSPDFKKIKILMKDTLVKSNRLIVNLGPGKYQWRIKAIDNISQTDFVTRSIFIDSLPLGSQSLLLSSPEDNAYVQSSELKFSWEPLSGVSGYRFQIHQVPFDEARPFREIFLNVPSLNQTLPEGSYQWRVRGESGAEASHWSSFRTINLDMTPPPVVVPLLPADKQLLNNKAVAFQWKAGSGDAHYYLLYVYKDNGSTLVDARFPAKVAGHEFNWEAGSFSGICSWQVKAIDKAGNASPLSTLRSFELPDL